jgi:hypothetical protein
LLESRAKNAKGIAMKRPLSSRISDLAISNNDTSNGTLTQGPLNSIIVSFGSKIACNRQPILSKWPLLKRVSQEALIRSECGDQ